MVNAEAFLELEQRILGVVLQDNDQLHRILHLISPEDFAHPIHQNIFSYIKKRFLKGQATDLILITNFLRKEEVPIEYVKKLTEEVFSGNIVSYAQMLKQISLRRGLSGIREHIKSELEANPEEIEPVILDVEKKLLEMLSKDARHRTLDLATSLQETLSYCQREKHQVVSSGFDSLDDLIGGFRAGEVSILAARPSLGKTALSLCLARNIATAGHPVMFFSLEMPKEQICMRLFSMETNILLEHFMRNNLSQAMLADCTRKIGELSETPLYINDNPLFNLGALRHILMVNKRKYGIEVIIVDYLQLLIGEKSDTRQQEVASISRFLKIISKELNIAVICLSQLGRRSETTAGKREPRLFDLRESGAIEQDADLVMLLHRPNEEVRNDIKLIVAKNRNGPLGECYFRLQRQTTKFTEHIPDDLEVFN
jgi:replicative DNA helicase